MSGLITTHEGPPRATKGGIDAQIEALFTDANYWPKGLYFRSRSHKRFMAALRGHVRAGDKCLDLGCGEFFKYKPFLQAHGLRWYGADVVDPKQSDPDYRKVEDNCIPYADDFFDVVCTYNVIEHFTDPEPMFAEIRRVLKSDGVFSGACAFWEREHESFFHLSYQGLKEILKRHGFELVSLEPSEYSGLVLVAQRFFGGNGRISRQSKRERLYSTLLCNLNWIPFLIINVMEFLRKKLAPERDKPFKDCSTLYFYARKRGDLSGDRVSGVREVSKPLGE